MALPRREGPLGRDAGFTLLLSPFAEPDDLLRGDPALSRQSAPGPQDARDSIVDAGGVESIARCPQQLPQMMAAGKCPRPSPVTRRLEFLVEKRARP